MSCKIKKISKITQISVSEKQFSQLEQDLDNIMDLMNKMNNVGTSEKCLYDYKFTNFRKDEAINVINTENFDPFLNRENNSEDMFEVEGVIDEK